MPPGEVTVGGAGAWGYVPPFRAAARERLSLDLGARGWIDRRVALGAEWSLLRDRTGDGEVDAGAGDLHVGTLVRVARIGPLYGYAGWEVKLPNARDEGELGTDETDVTFGAAVGWRDGPWTVIGAAGLGVWGNPLKFANQDDVPLLRLEGGWERGWVRVAPALRADLATARNPARVTLGAEARVGPSWFVEVGCAAGLTPAAADARVGLGFGWASPPR